MEEIKDIIVGAGIGFGASALAMFFGVKLSQFAKEKALKELSQKPEDLTQHEDYENIL